MYATANEHKGTWAEVFDKTNRVRTGVAILAMWGQQITGQAFPSQYGVIFYQAQGFGDRAFLFNVASNIISLESCAWILVLLGATYLLWSAFSSPRQRPALRSVAILVLGDIGRSPRMMYHAESFATNKFQTYLIGYGGERCYMWAVLGIGDGVMRAARGEVASGQHALY